MIDTVRTNVLRVGNFTSSEICKLVSMGKRPMTDEEKAARPKTGKGSKTEFMEDGPGEAFYSYIEDKRMERKLGRPLNEDASARALTWGKVAEKVAFLTLGFDYHLTSKETLVHPKFECWSGTPDGESIDSVLEIKCPFTIKSFCELSECKTIQEIRDKHRDGEKFYWQCVSNAILTNKKYAELVVFMPYLTQIKELKESLEEWEGHPNDVAWIHFSADENLPYVIEGNGYNNIHKIRFEVSEQDKKFLTHRVEIGARLLKA